MHELRDELRQIRDSVMETRDASVRTEAKVDAMSDKVDAIVKWKDGDGEAGNSVDARIFILQQKHEATLAKVVDLEEGRKSLIRWLFGAIGAAGLALLKSVWAWFHFSPPTGGHP